MLPPTAPPRAHRRVESPHIDAPSPREQVGYPDKWIDYTPLTLDETNLLQNIVASSRFEHGRQLARMNKPVDPTRWEMPPQTINAYFHPLRNEIVFPAAFLQFPLFAPDADDAVNYGAMGAVIGHEMTHGYDDQGRKFDDKGNMADWWTEEDASKFDAQAKKLVSQFAGCVCVRSIRLSVWHACRDACAAWCASYCGTMATAVASGAPVHSAGPRGVGSRSRRRTQTGTGCTGLRSTAS